MLGNLIKTLLALALIALSAVAALCRDPPRPGPVLAVSLESVLEAPHALRPRPGRERVRRITAPLTSRPELLGLLTVAGVLNLWGLSINGWANTYYSAAVRSMSTSWHDFLFASLDRTGLMTVDKPPLSLWVEALSARVFGFHPLALLIPQALMGMAAVVFLYDLVQRRFGRAGRICRRARARHHAHGRRRIPAQQSR